MSGELAVQLFNTLRKVTVSTNATVCILTHTTKADRREENSRSPFPIGSVYFENLARATSELRPQESKGGDDLRVGLFPRKQNMARPAPLGLQLLFSRDSVVVEHVQVADVATEQGATQSVILAELERGPAGVGELAHAVGTTPGAIRVGA